MSNEQHETTVRESLLRESAMTWARVNWLLYVVGVVFLALAAAQAGRPEVSYLFIGLGFLIAGLIRVLAAGKPELEFEPEFKPDPNV